MTQKLKSDTERVTVSSNVIDNVSNDHKKVRVPWNKGLTKETNEILMETSKKISKSSKGKPAWNKGLTKETNTSVKSSSDKRRGVPRNFSEETKINMRRKERETKRRNGTLNSSALEDAIYLDLVSKYGEQDVEREYCDYRYPFHCDFYVKSKDMFIEYNGTFDHYIEPYDPTNHSHQEKLKFFQNKAFNAGAKSRYNNLIYWWTIRDPLKLKTMRDNNLNFVVIYKNITIIK